MAERRENSPETLSELLVFGENIFKFTRKDCSRPPTNLWN